MSVSNRRLAPASKISINLASNFKGVCSREKDHESLSTRLLEGKQVQTAAMRYRIENEDDVALQYSQHFVRAVFPVGFVLNPSVPHLGCSPDRRVFDVTENNPWSPLEVRCPQAENLSVLKYLHRNSRSGAYSLKRTHAYYHQAMGCMGLTGSAWEDFYISCRSEFHCERIYFDSNLSEEMFEKFNTFYFNFHLPVSVQ